MKEIHLYAPEEGIKGQIESLDRPLYLSHFIRLIASTSCHIAYFCFMLGADLRARQFRAAGQKAVPVAGLMASSILQCLQNCLSLGKIPFQ
jgi:hypothetical protein